jgi:methyl-accepting chemotaxis protein
MLKDMRIGRRLGLGFGAVIVLLALVAGTGYWSVKLLERQLDDAVNIDARLVELSQRANGLTANLRRYEKDSFLQMGETADRERYLQQWRDSKRELDTAIDELELGFRAQDDDTTAADLEKVKKLRANLAEYAAGYARVSSQVAEGKVADSHAADAAMLPYKDSARELETMAVEMAQDHAEGLTALAKAVDAQVGDIILTLMVLVTVALVVAALIGMAITRSITAPIDDAVGLARRIARGDLTERVEVDRKDEAGLLLMAMKEMADNLARVIGEVRSGAGALSSASGQVSATSQSLSQGTSEQAASVVETTSSLE